MAIKPKKIVQQLGLYLGPQDERKSYVRLDFNENTVGFPEVFSSQDAVELTRYPEYKALYEGLANLYDLPQSWLVPTNGSDEAIFAIAHTFIEPGQDTALVSKPTFVTISHSLVLAGASLIEVPCTPLLEFDTTAIAAALHATKVKIAFFACPDNPTGDSIDLGLIDQWCTKFPETLFVVDEAYSEYASESALSLLSKHVNLLVTRTFSKAWGLASLRLGVVLGAPELIDPIYKVRLPYTVNGSAAAAVVKMLPFANEVVSKAKETMLRKVEVLRALDQRELKYIPGGANFFLLQMGETAEKFCSYLRDLGILVRNRSAGSPGSANPLWGMVRISIGTEQENARLVSAIDAFVELVGSSTIAPTADVIPKAEVTVSADVNPKAEAATNDPNFNKAKESATKSSIKSINKSIEVY